MHEPDAFAYFHKDSHFYIMHVFAHDKQAATNAHQRKRGQQAAWLS